jgi:polyferredoxin
MILFVALLLGRLFCGYLCPMGTTIDFSDWLIRRNRRTGVQPGPEVSARFRRLKYWLLIFTAGTALVGVSSVFLFSPLTLVTRFYGFVLHPIILMVSNLFLDTFRPVFPQMGLERLTFVHFEVHSFNTNLFVAGLFFGILMLGLTQSRFWCRNLCPAGAILALFSRKPFFRRCVSDDCTRCARCFQSCPMNAIGEDYAP